MSTSDQQFCGNCGTPVSRWGICPKCKTQSKDLGDTFPVGDSFPTPAERSPGTRNWWLVVGGVGVIVIIIAVVLIVPALVNQKGNRTTTSTSTFPKVVITSPTQGTKLGEFITVRGTAANIPAGKELWLFVQEDGVEGYYPQNMTPIMVFGDRTWSVGIHIGQPSDPIATGKTFQLFPALIDHNDSEAHSVIQTFFNQTGAYNPIFPLPSGIELLNPVQVVRG